MVCWSVCEESKIQRARAKEEARNKRQEAKRPEVPWNRKQRQSKVQSQKVETVNGFRLLDLRLFDF